MQPYISRLANGASIMGPVDELSNPIVFWDDFLTHETTGWLETLTGTSATIDSILTEPGGAILFDAANADNVIGIQLHNAAYTCAAGKNVVFEARVKPTDADGTGMFVGLATIDAAIIAGVTASIGFKVADGAASTKIACVSGAESTTTTVDLVDATYNTLRFVVTGTEKVVFYIDGVKVATHTTVPVTAITPSCELVPTGAGDDLTLDYILAAMDR